MQIIVLLISLQPFDFSVVVFSSTKPFQTSNENIVRKKLMDELCLALHGFVSKLRETSEMVCQLDDLLDCFQRDGRIVCLAIFQKNIFCFDDTSAYHLKDHNENRKLERRNAIFIAETTGPVFQERIPKGLDIHHVSLPIV